MTPLVQRALKVLDEFGSFEGKEEEFAARFGVTARHLHRLFREELGKTPKQIYFEGRLKVAKQLLAESRLPIPEIAASAGFGSLRLFNDAFQKRFHRKPSEIRRQPGAEPNEGLLLFLAYRLPFDFEGLLSFYRSHPTGNLESFTADSMTRVMEFDGKVGEVEISNDAAKARLRLVIRFPDLRHLPAILNRVRALFDLDSDPLVVAKALGVNAKMRRLLAKHPGIRLPSGWDPFELAIGTVLGQLVSVPQARALLGALIDSLGRDSGLVRNGKPVKLFPSPTTLAASDLNAVGTTRARKKTIRALALAVSEGTLSLDPAQDAAQFIQRARSIPGVGPWTATYMAMKVLRDPDSFPSTDLILARALELHPKEVVEKMSPWRGYAAMLFWKEYAETLKKTNRKKPPEKRRVLGIDKA